MIMRGIFTGIIFLFVLVPAVSFGADEQRIITNSNIGNISFSAPVEWKPETREHIQFGTTFYRLIPLNNEFELEILFNDLKHMKLDALVDKDLEHYIETNMYSAVSKSVEGKVTARRFGVKQDGVYASLTDKAPGPGEFIIFTQGVRLVGKRVILFTMFSNHKEGADLKKVLDVVDSVRFAK
jgi:hypothetical protein